MVVLVTWSIVYDWLAGVLLMAVNGEGRSPTTIVWPTAKLWFPPQAAVVQMVSVTLFPDRTALLMGRRVELPLGKLRMMGMELFAEFPAVSKVMSAPLSVS
jgi:hypothetical protein